MTTVHADETIVIAKLANEQGNFAKWWQLNDRRFEGCRIEGPAILGPIEGVEFDRCKMEGDVETFLWEVPRGKLIIGLVPVVECVFERCLFVGVGFAGPPDLMDYFRKELTQA